MPRNRQNEGSVLQKIAGSSRSFQSREFRHSVPVGIGDDAALFRSKPGHEMVLTCDWFLEGTHFLLRKHPPDAVGWKCLARAVSDIAAMGGAPRCFLLSLALPESHTGRWLGLFLGGLRRASRKFQCALVGGDTTRRNEILINVTVVGELPTGLAVRRSRAREGDLIYVSGALGGAELGLQSLRRAKGLASRNSPLLNNHLYPEPRLELGRWLAVRKLATSMMDLSDGLSSDLASLCHASGVGALLESGKIPQVQIPHDSPRSEKSLPRAKCWWWMSRATRRNSCPAAGIPSGKNCRRGQTANLTEGSAVQIGTRLWTGFGRIPQLA